MRRPRAVGPHLRAAGVLRNIVEGAASGRPARRRRGSPPIRTNRHAPPSARRRQTASHDTRRVPRGRLGSASKTGPVKHCAPRFPAGHASRSPCGLLASAGIRAGGVPARLPARVARSGPRPRATLHAKRARAGLRHATRPLTVAGAAQVGDLRAEYAPCFPFNRATHARAPTRRQFRSGPRERQESVENACERRPGPAYSRQEAGVLRLETLQMSECALFRAKMLGL